MQIGADVRIERPRPLEILLDGEIVGQRVEHINFKAFEICLKADVARAKAYRAYKEYCEINNEDKWNE